MQPFDCPGRRFIVDQAVEAPFPAAQVPVLSLIRGGDLVMPTGKLIARDPLTSSPVSPLKKVQVAPGTYPVWVSLVATENDGVVVGAASIHFAEEVPTRWTMALRPNENVAALRPGRIFGYYVDSGLGCFFDASGAKSLAIWKARYQSTFFQQLQADRTTIPGTACERGSILLDPQTGVNLVFFTSGLGDSCYASYLGYGNNGVLVAVLTDFFVFAENMPEQERLTALYRGKEPM